MQAPWSSSFCSLDPGSCSLKAGKEQELQDMVSLHCCPVAVITTPLFTVKVSQRREEEAWGVRTEVLQEKGGHNHYGGGSPSPTGAWLHVW